MPVLVPDQHFDAAPGVAVLLAELDGRAQSLSLAGIGARIAPATLHDFPFALAPHDDISQMIHELLVRQIRASRTTRRPQGRCRRPPPEAAVGGASSRTGEPVGCKRVGFRML